MGAWKNDKNRKNIAVFVSEEARNAYRIAIEKYSKEKTGDSPAIKVERFILSDDFKK